MKNHKSLVLSGGGAKGAFQVGVISKLAELNYSFDSFAGVSVGAINAAFLAQFDDFKEGAEKLEELWLSFETKDVYKKWFLWPLSVLWKPSIYNSAPLLKMLEKHLTGDYRRPVVVGTVDLETGMYLRLTAPTPEDVHASAAFPAFLNGSNGMIDGGLKNITPLGDAIKLFDCDEAVVIMAQAHGITPVEKGWRDSIKAYDVALRSIDIMISEIMENDIKIASMYNKMTYTNSTDKKYVSLEVHRPDSYLDFDALKFDPQNIKKMIDIGKDYVERTIQEKSLNKLTEITERYGGYDNI